MLTALLLNERPLAPFALMAPVWLRDQGLIDWPLAPQQWPDVFHDRALGWLIWRPHLEALLQRVEQVLAAHHQQHPQDMGPEQRRVRNIDDPYQIGFSPDNK